MGVSCRATAGGVTRGRPTEAYCTGIGREQWVSLMNSLAEKKTFKVQSSFDG